MEPESDMQAIPWITCGIVEECCGVMNVRDRNAQAVKIVLPINRDMYLALGKYFESLQPPGMPVNKRINPRTTLKVSLVGDAEMPSQSQE